MTVKQQVSGQQATMDVSGLSPGVYVVKVKSDDRLLVGKFIKQ